MKSDSELVLDAFYVNRAKHYLNVIMPLIKKPTIINDTISNTRLSYLVTAAIGSVIENKDVN